MAQTDRTKRGSPYRPFAGHISRKACRYMADSVHVVLVVMGKGGDEWEIVAMPI
jgi:hypothetical protein